MGRRCATLPYLRRVSEQREWKGVTPSMAGSGARMLYLKQTTDYTVDPMQRTFAVLGTDVHSTLAHERLTVNTIAEETFESGGTADLLEEDESGEMFYVCSCCGKIEKIS